MMVVPVADIALMGMDGTQQLIPMLVPFTFGLNGAVCNILVLQHMCNTILDNFCLNNTEAT